MGTRNRMSVARCCCNSVVPCPVCDTGWPRYFRVTFANGYEPPLLQRVLGQPCQWANPTGLAPFEKWTLTLSEDGGVPKASLLYYHNFPPPNLFSRLYEANLASYYLLDCCVDLDGLELACVTEFAECPAGLDTLTLEAICEKEGYPTECSMCQDGLIPTEVEVTLDGVVSDSANCAPLNKTYVASLPPAAPYCTWLFGYTPSFEFAGFVTPSYDPITDTGYLSVSVSIRGGYPCNSWTGCAQWIKTFSGRLNCLTFDEDIPLSAVYGCCGFCDFSLATCHVRSS